MVEQNSWYVISCVSFFLILTGSSRWRSGSVVSVRRPIPTKVEIQRLAPHTRTKTGSQFSRFVNSWAQFRHVVQFWICATCPEIWDCSVKHLKGVSASALGGRLAPLYASGAALSGFTSKSTPRRALWLASRRSWLKWRQPKAKPKRKVALRALQNQSQSQALDRYEKHWKAHRSIRQQF